MAVAFVSPRIGNVTPFCCAKAWLAKGLSTLTPKTWVSEASSFAMFAWKAFISFVQPPVKAKTKKASATCFFPLKSCSETGVVFEPSYCSSVKSGAMSPTLIFSGSAAFFSSSAANAEGASASNINSRIFRIESSVNVILPRLQDPQRRRLELHVRARAGDRAHLRLRQRREDAHRERRRRLRVADEREAHVEV